MVAKKTAVGRAVAVPAATSVDSFIEKALISDVPVETMEKLFALREKHIAAEAKAAFVRAMADFQRDCPVIKKTKAVKNKDGREVYKFAPLDSIVSQVKAELSKHNLSYTIETQSNEKTITSICRVTHIMGHSETSEFAVPIGQEKYMTEVQKYGARATFAKRNAFCNALGILTGDEDTDATQTDVPKEPASPKSKIMLLLRRLDADTETKELIEAAVKNFTALDLVEENYDEIIGRLEVTVQDREENEND